MLSVYKYCLLDRGFLSDSLRNVGMCSRTHLDQLYCLSGLMNKTNKLKCMYKLEAEKQTLQVCLSVCPVMIYIVFSGVILF